MILHVCFELKPVDLLIKNDPYYYHETLNSLASVCRAVWLGN